MSLPHLKRLFSGWQAFGFFVIALFASGLYIPYLQNPLVFDDVNIFHSARLTIAAITPWELGIRGLPYFTLGWVETQIGQIAAHRLFSLLLHILVSYQLFRLLDTLLLEDVNSSNLLHNPNTNTASLTALLVALAFVCHPVAVYGAGYLVQRTIVFATLFTLLCLRCMVGAITQNNMKQAASAAFWASLAILSKEHAVAVPVAAAALGLAVRNRENQTLKIISVFLILSLPAMVFALQLGFYTVGQPYEPAMAEIEAELYGLPDLNGHYEKWLLSASTQAQLFFAYWGQWLWPNVANMSVDLRVDFRRVPWAPPWIYITSVVAIPLVSVIAAIKYKSFRLPAFALVYTCLLFSLEMATIRFQEPYVLYRSYLWAIGYSLMVAILLNRLPSRLGAIFLTMALPVLVFQSINRLDTFRSKLDLWEDAGAKLPKLEIAGASRILFNRGGERFRTGDVSDAMTDIDQAIRLNPKNGRYRIAKAIALLKQNRLEESARSLDEARLLLPRDPDLMFVEYQIFEARGLHIEASAMLADAAKLGSFNAKNEILSRRLRATETKPSQ